MKPSKLYIFYKAYDIKYIDGYITVDGETVRGKVSFENKLIEISTVDSTNSDILEVLIHEIIHVIIKEMGITTIKKSEDEEDIIDQFTIAVVDILLRNEWIKLK